MRAFSMKLRWWTPAVGEESDVVLGPTEHDGKDPSVVLTLLFVVHIDVNNATTLDPVHQTG